MYVEGNIFYYIIFVQVAYHRTLPQAWISLCNCYKLRYFCCRLHDWNDPASLRTHSLPHQQSVRQESPCEGHHVLDTQPVLPLGCESAPWQLSEATHDRSMWLIDEVQSSETVIITMYLELVVFIFCQACLLMILQTLSIIDLHIIFFFCLACPFWFS